jgi:hypothetical protein
MITKGVLAAVVGAMTLTGAASVPSFASAQSYGYDGQTYYNPCQRESTNRGTIGALIGGALGAAIGSNAAGRGVRTEGALLGGAVGAVGGAVVGNRSAACNQGYAPRNSYYQPAPPPPAPSSYYENRGYSAPYDGDRSYGYGYGARDDGAYAYDREGNSYPVADRPVGADGCTLAESPIYLPDGRVQKRFVRVCQDRTGRYQVVE